VPPRIPVRALQLALQDGTSAAGFSLTHFKVGDLSLPTGQLVACDPFVQSETKPFPVEFPQGQFPVTLAIAGIKTDQRVAFAIVNFSSETPILWEMLTFESQNVRALKEDEVFGYAVDSGTGSFMDVSASHFLVEKLAANDQIASALMAEMEKTYRHTWSWVNAEFNNDSNMLAFSSGFGDGVYASYVGYTPEGRIARVVTDFDVVILDSDIREESATQRDSSRSRFWQWVRGKKRRLS
jgi:Protein of unknown function (DUF4241)